MGFDNLVYFLLCEEGVLLGVAFPGFFSKNVLIDLFSGLFRFRTKDFKRSLILPNDLRPILPVTCLRFTNTSHFYLSQYPHQGSADQQETCAHANCHW